MPVYKSKTRNSWYCSFYYTDWTGIRSGELPALLTDNFDLEKA